VKGQSKLYLDSALKNHYIKSYGFHENRMCIPFYCDPFFEKNYKKNDTIGLCGRYVFIDTSFIVRILPIFSLPCWHHPRFSEGLCAVNINNEIVFIDEIGKIVIKTGLSACTFSQNKALPFKNGLSKIYQGSQHIKKYQHIYYINKKGEKVKSDVYIRIIPKNENPNIYVSTNLKKANNKIETNINLFKIPEYIPESGKMGYFHADEIERNRLKNKFKNNKNLQLVQYRCGEYQMENMAIEDTVYCGKYVFIDSLFNIKISKGFKIPCAFEPEFSEGLCAVAIDSNIAYIDTLGRPIINTGLNACNDENNKASTFKNGIATLFQGDAKNKGLYTTIAINTKGERVKLLEFDELALAEEKQHLFKNLQPEECLNCFVGKGKSNGIWFLIEKNGKIRKKLDLK
jgi:hypothetical protein